MRWLAYIVTLYVLCVSVYTWFLTRPAHCARPISYQWAIGTLQSRRDEYVNCQSEYVNCHSRSGFNAYLVFPIISVGFFLRVVKVLDNKHATLDHTRVNSAFIIRF